MSFIDHAFAMLHHEIPGQWLLLRAHLQDAPPLVQREFYRVIQELTDEIHTQRRKAQHWGFR